MARTARILRASGCVVLAATLTACSGAPASTPGASVAAVASPTAAPSPAPAASAAPVPSASTARSESPSPARSHKPLPSIDPSELDAIMTASITLVDLADADLSVSVAYVDPTSTKPFDLGTYSLKFTEQLTNQVPPGTYRLVFHQPVGGQTAQSCSIDVADGDAFTFAAVNGAVAVTKSGTPPKKPGDLSIATSSLCAK